MLNELRPRSDEKGKSIYYKYLCENGVETVVFIEAQASAFCTLFTLFSHSYTHPLVICTTLSLRNNRWSNQNELKIAQTFLLFDLPFYFSLSLSLTRLPFAARLIPLHLIFSVVLILIFFSPCFLLSIPILICRSNVMGDWDKRVELKRVSSKASISSLHYSISIRFDILFSFGGHRTPIV